MTENSLKTNNGRKILLYRGYTETGDLSATQYNAPTVFKVGVSNADISETDTDLTSPVIISGASYTKDFVTGYPVIDMTNYEIIIKCFLNSGEANGNDLDSLGIFNEDSSPLLASVHKFVEESKASTDEFNFVCKERILGEGE